MTGAGISIVCFMKNGGGNFFTGCKLQREHLRYCFFAKHEVFL